MNRISKTLTRNHKLTPLHNTLCQPETFIKKTKILKHGGYIYFLFSKEGEVETVWSGSEKMRSVIEEQRETPLKKEEEEEQEGQGGYDIEIVEAAFGAS